MFKISLWIVFYIALLIVGPIISIWALNTLFKLDIAYNVWSWLALGWLQTILATKIDRTKS